MLLPRVHPQLLKDNSVIVESSALGGAGVSAFSTGQQGKFSFLFSLILVPFLRISLHLTRIGNTERLCLASGKMGPDTVLQWMSQGREGIMCLSINKQRWISPRWAASLADVCPWSYVNSGHHIDCCFCYICIWPFSFLQ